MKAKGLLPSPPRAVWMVALLAAAGGALPAAGESVDFSRDVLPILSDACFQCHGPDAQEGRKGDLRLDDEQDVKRPREGDSVDDPLHVVAPGDPSASLLMERITASDPEERMPPPDLGRPLDAAQIATLRRWIEEGASWGKHWAFEPLERPQLPVEIEEKGKPRLERPFHPLDAFVAAKLDREGLVANGPASPATLVRRLALDLTGLPPTPQEVDAYVADARPDAWERLVDRFLHSPAFGERMAWDWLEAARYADSNGYQGDRERTMWPWRDWVAKAFNENLPFDTFTRWQVAGDLMPDADTEPVLATAFHRNHMINGEGGRIPEENRVDYVMDMAETVGTVWLGLTFNCCRCHDHKFDPLKQREYYEFTAFFNQTPVDGSGGDPQTAPVLAVPGTDEARAVADAEAQLREVEAALPPAPAFLEADGATEIPEAVRQAWAKPREQRQGGDWDVLITYVESRAAEYAAALGRVRQAQERLEESLKRVPKVMVMRDRPEKRPTYILDRGLYNQPGEEVTAGVPQALPDLGDSRDADRRDLAHWLVSPEQPLTARVTVNRLWQILFGIGLVKTAEDFGVQAEYPPQRELLDWLAAEFRDSGWNTKQLLRLIVTSETYRRSSSQRTPAGRESVMMDPENRFLARGARFRLPSWMIRDQALAAAALLDRRVGGAPVYPYQPEGVWAEATFGDKQYERDEGSALYRRSLYTFWRRIVGPTLFFDTAKRQVCEVKPLRTNTPMHALTTLNDVTFVEAARALASRVLGRGENDEERLREATGLVLGRAPSDREEALWLRSLERAETAFADDPDAAARFLSHGEHRPDPHLSQVTLAAWTALCLNLLNLDETLTKE